MVLLHTPELLILRGVEVPTVHADVYHRALLERCVCMRRRSHPHWPADVRATFVVGMRTADAIIAPDCQPVHTSSEDSVVLPQRSAL